MTAIASTMTAPSSPKPEDGIPPAQAPGSVTAPPPGSGAPPEQAPLPEATPGGATPVEDLPEEDDEGDDDDEEPEQAQASLMDIDRPEHARERAGYLSGLLVGLAVARLSPIAAEGFAAEIVSAIAQDYGAPPEAIQAGVDADAHAVLQDYLRLGGQD